MAASNWVPPDGTDTGSKIPGGLDFRTYQELKNGIHGYLLDKVDLNKIFTPDGIQGVLAQLKMPFSGDERERLSREIMAGVFALGPLEPLKIRLNCC